MAVSENASRRPRLLTKPRASPRMEPRASPPGGAKASAARCMRNATGGAGFVGRTGEVMALLGDTFLRAAIGTSLKLG